MITDYDLSGLSDVRLFEVYFELERFLELHPDEDSTNTVRRIASILDTRTLRERRETSLKLEPFIKPFYDQRFLRRT